MHLKSYNKTNGYKSTCLLGAHFSVAGGLHHAIHEAHAHGCNALQIFTKNASTWKERELSLPEIERFDQARKDTGITAIASHAPYLINLATNEKGKYAMSCRALTNELLRSSMLDIPYVVLHPGAHMGVGEKPGSTKIISGLKEVFARTPDATTRLLLETTAGQGSSIGHTFEQLALIMEKVNCERRLGICLDTSHIFAAGYDIRTKTSYHRTINLLTL